MKDGDFSMNAEFEEMRQMAKEKDVSSNPPPCAPHPFQVGQTVIIGNNLHDELVRLGVDASAATAFHKRWAGSRVKVLAAWSEEGQHWVTVDMCCEVPAQCCSLQA